MYAALQSWIRRTWRSRVWVLGLVGLWLVAAAQLTSARTDPREVARGSAVAPPASNPAGGSESGCRSCHTESSPSPAKVALRACARESSRAVAEQFAHLKGPAGVITLDVLSTARDIQNHRDRFGSVRFDHESHAEWANLSAGCAACHHYTPEGATHPACKTCHEIGDKHEDMRKPGLKGAYHRQCLGCHREWSHETNCEVCHEPRTNGGDALAAVTSKDDIIGVKHPTIPAPREKVYRTSFPENGAMVYFAHDRHTGQYQLRCVDCHEGDGCVRCHENSLRPSAVARPASEAHSSCSECHDTQGQCSKCHREPGKSAPQAFNHASTGFSLQPHHRRVSCRSCHDSLPYTRLSGECSSCHREWLTSGIDHAHVAGVAFDATHGEIDCETCHSGNLFVQPPTCGGCHDDKSYPADVPGKRVQPESARVEGNTTRAGNTAGS